MVLKPRLRCNAICILIAGCPVGVARYAVCVKRGRKGGVETEAADFTVVSGQVDCRAAVTGERGLQYRGFPDRLCIVAPRAYAWLSIILRMQREIERWRERERREKNRDERDIRSNRGKQEEDMHGATGWRQK